MLINFKKAGIYTAVKYSFLFDIIKILKNIFLYFLIIIAFILLGDVDINISLTGLFLVFFSIFTPLFILDNFFNSKLKNPKIKTDINKALDNPNQYNIAEFFDYETAKTIKNSINYAKKNKLKEVDSSVLLYFCIKDNPELNFIFSRILINIKTIQKILKEEISTSKKESFKKSSIGFSKNVQKAILMALELNRDRGDYRIEIGDLIAGLAEHSYTLNTIITAKNIKPKDIEVLNWWLHDTKAKIKKNKRWWEYENLSKYGSLARDWAIPYTLTLDKYSTNFIDIIRKRNALFNKAIGKDREIEIIERTLSKTDKNSVLIVADIGSGRIKMVSELARRAFLGISLPNINYKKIVLLDLQLIISRSKSSEEVFLILNQIFNEVVCSGNVILVIKDIHNYVGQEKKLGVIDITGILNKFLSFENFRLIGITSFDGFRKKIFQNQSFLNNFEKVEMTELSKEDTTRILEGLTFSLEKQHKIFITYPAIKATIEYADKYLQQEPFPGKAVNLLNDVIYYAVYSKDFIIEKKDVERVIFEKTKIPVGETNIKEADILLNLEELIKQRLIGQKEAIKAVSSSLRRARSEITIKGGPMGGFLFLGPTGVGKTELSKVLAKIYFGRQERMVRIDMSEFQNITDVSRLIGSVNEQGYLTTQIRENPFSLVLLDEIEKAHPDILNLFLQILDEGFITDGVGRKINFKNTIIIATSNAGAKIILDCAGKDIDQEKLKEKLLKYIFENAIFKPEFINRFDAVVLFHSLSKENLLDISALLLNDLKKNLYCKKNIDLTITDELKEEITRLSYKPEFGAREMKRVIQDKIEDKIAISLLNNTIKAGDKIKIDTKTFNVIKNA